jgi:hypothetical protein
MSETKERTPKHHAHIELLRRYIKAREIKHFVTLTSSETAFVPSAKEMPEKGHSVTFIGKRRNCECTSFIQGFSRDPEFECYHILAAKMRADQANSIKIAEVTP